MDFNGCYVIPAAPEIVWEALNDPQMLKTCIPGCESLIKTDPTHFAATAVLKIGPVKATFKASIEQAELDPPRRCILRGEGQGGVAGFARGEAEVLLAPDADGTVLDYTARATIGGKLAQIGQRLIDGAARQIADDFFARFAAAVAVANAAPAPIVEETLPVLPQMPPSAAPEVSPVGRREGLAPEIWVVGLIGVIAVLLVLFGLVLRPG
ncbi:MAG TPA: carbon monoxide dehydrogenase subunit G [Rhizomicrobium sp.]